MTDANDGGMTAGRTESDNNGQPRVEPWKDKQTLVRLYHEEGKSQYDIAARFDVSQPTIGYWMDELDIDTRQPSDRECQDVYFNESDGYFQLLVPGGDDTVSIYQHQLVALVDHRIEEVFGDGRVVHHEINSSVALDLPANLTPMFSGEHRQHHNEDYDAHTATARVLADIFADDAEMSGSISMDRERCHRLRHWHQKIKVE